MPQMKEIYQNYSYEYDELVSNEDYQNNIPGYLHRIMNFSGKSVLEPGAGTGRLTAMYIEQAAKVYCYDGSAHMLEKAARNLSAFGDKAEFTVCDNLNLDSLEPSADAVIQGWSFGHTVSDNADRLEPTVDKLVTDCRARLNPEGIIIFLESLGTNTDNPDPPNDDLKSFFRLLEEKHNFERTVLRTDYRFESNQEAERIMGFFFGEEMGRNLKLIEEGIVREYTGAWHLKI